MLKDSTAVIGLGLGGMTVTYEFQEKNYLTYSVNGSEQDIKSIPNAKNSMRLEGYDGLAGNRELAYEALKRNKHILKKLKEIEKKIIIVIASAGGSTGSGCITFVSEILVQNPDKIVVPVILMPRQDESIQKRLNAYNVAKELMQIEELGAIIFVNNESYSDLKKINTILVNMLDAFLSDTSYSSGSNFDDSEKMKMLKDNGAFVIAMLSDKNSENNRVTTADMVKALTVKNIFLPINADGIVGNLGIINQGKNKIDEHEIEKAIGVPENIFTGSNGAVNIACASGLSFPVEYIKKLGKDASDEQRARLSRRQSLTLLDDLEEIESQSNADQAQAEYAAMRVTNEQEKFKNVQNYYSGWNDRYSNYTEQHQKKYEKSEAHGNYTNSKKYDTQINDLQKQRKYKQNEVTDLQKQLNASVKSGIIKKGSEEWLEMTNQILEAQNAVSDFDTQIEQAKQDKITTVYEEMFDRAIEKANRLKDKIGSINDLITEDMMIDKDTGNLTEMGALSITMNSQQLDTELNNLQTYVKKRQQIMDDFANGSSKSKYGEKTYDELMSENDSAMQESLKNVNNYRQSIISIVTNQAKAVQDAMFKEIDARKKALKKKKEYYDYDKTIKKKTDEIELIKQQIRGLEGLTDAESKAQKARLEASLKDKQDDLDDTVRDHVYDITVNGLDDLETQLSEDFEKWSNQLSSDLAKMSDAISNTISGAGENYSDMMAGIDYILNNIGGITSGQYFTSQDKSNMKKSNSFDTGYNSGHLKGYAKGTKHVGGVPRVAMTNENGREIIVTKKGILTPVEPSDGIIPNDMTETLMKMAERQQNYAMNSNFKMPELKVKDASGNSVNNVYNTFTVQGDLTRDTLPELNKILDLASSKTQNDIRKNKRRFG